ncbi:MAG: M1 family peptidase, partial [Chloroflexi bacterium]|nr:M1 family peptidase [Chloroflexota bacterium]
MPKSNAFMLPASVRPVRYRLTLEPNLSDFTFRGQESVDIDVLEPTSKIVLNSAEIAVQSCSLTLADGSAVTPQNISLDESEETLTFEFESTIPTGAARLDIEFTGAPNDRLH